MNALAQFDPSQLPAKARKIDVEAFNAPMSEGMSTPFTVVSIRGKAFRFLHNGDEHLIKNEDGDPIQSLRVVLLKVAGAVSRTYYKSGYEEGDRENPDCSSVDGITPDASVENPISSKCQTCPMNVYGSKVNDAGNKTFACSSARRLAIAPYPDIENERFGGPSLLRVSYKAMENLREYKSDLLGAGIPYAACVTKLSFDTSSSYPLLKFDYVKTLDESEYDVVDALLNDPKLEEIVGSSFSAGEAHPDEAVANTSEPEMGRAEEKPKAKPKAAAKKAPAKKAAPKTAAPKSEPEAEGEEGAITLDDLEEELEASEGEEDVKGVGDDIESQLDGLLA